MIPYRFYGLIIGSNCLPAALYSVVVGALGLAGVGDGNGWTVVVGVVLGA